MSWHFSLGPEEASSADCFSDGVPPALSRLIPTAVASFSRDNATKASTRSRSGTTSAPSTVAPGADTSTSSAAASRARTSAAQAARVRVQDFMAKKAACGASMHASSTKSNPLGQSSKILRTYAIADLSPSSKILPTSGMMRHGTCSTLPPSELPKRVSASGLLPTVTTRGNELSISMMKWPAHRRLAEMTKKLGHPGGPWIAFREWMMGWPIGWTALEPLETARCLEWSRWLGRLSREGFFKPS